MKKIRCLFGLMLWALLAQSSIAGTLVQFHISVGGTAVGDIDVELYDKDKPITVKNFLRYIQSGLYTNSFLHRCPTDSVTGLTDFVLQGGAYDVDNYGATNQILDVLPTFPPIVDEFATGARYSNVYGTIAMAKQAGNTNSATDSWFFNLNNNAFLDNADTNDLFAVFGHVVRGTNVLNQFIGRSYGAGLVNINSPLDSLPVNYTNTSVPSYTNLYLVNITILSAQMQIAANGTRQITWNSINGLTNNVEYSTNLPPIWQILTSTNGTGNSITVTDSVTNLARRFYRIHVLY